MRQTTAIRQKVKELFEADNDINQKFVNIYDKYVEGLSSDQLPASSVTVGSGEYGDDFSETDGVDSELSVQIHIHEPTNPEDVLDELAELVELIFTANNTLDGLVEFVVPKSFFYALNKDTGMAVMTLNYNVKYEV